MWNVSVQLYALAPLSPAKAPTKRWRGGLMYGSVVAWGTVLQAGRSWFRFLMKSLHKFTYQPHYSPGVDSASNWNAYQESSWWVERGRPVRLKTLPPSVSWEPRRLTTLWAFTACWRNGFTSFYLTSIIRMDVNYRVLNFTAGYYLGCLLVYEQSEVFGLGEFNYKGNCRIWQDD
jgi:hypothetical protein